MSKKKLLLSFTGFKLKNAKVCVPSILGELERFQAKDSLVMRDEAGTLIVPLFDNTIISVFWIHVNL